MDEVLEVLGKHYGIENIKIMIDRVGSEPETECWEKHVAIVGDVIWGEEE